MTVLFEIVTPEVWSTKMPSNPAFSTVKPVSSVPAAAEPEMTTPFGGEVFPAASIVAPWPTSASRFVTVTVSPYVPAATEIVSPAFACPTAYPIVLQGDAAQLPTSAPLGETYLTADAAPAEADPTAATAAMPPRARKSLSMPPPSLDEPRRSY